VAVNLSSRVEFSSGPFSRSRSKT
jgi:hypothetical protein